MTNLRPSCFRLMGLVKGDKCQQDAILYYFAFCTFESTFFLLLSFSLIQSTGGPRYMRFFLICEFAYRYAIENDAFL
jgi:hypothetical protein